MKAGTVLDIWEGDDLHLVALTGEEKGKLKVVTVTGREMRIADNRVANDTGIALDPHLPAAALGQALKPRQEAIERSAATIDLTALWEVLTDEGGAYELDDLADLALGTRDGAARSAVLRRLVVDRLYFTRKRLSFVPRTREELGETVRRREREAERARQRQQFLAVAQAWLAEPAGEAPDWPAGSQGFLTTLRDLAVRGLESERVRDATALLDDLGEGGRADKPLAAFDLLVRLHVLSADANLLLERHGVRREWSAEILGEAERVAAAGLPDEPWRRDLRGLQCWAIDDPETTEVDDALSLEELGGERWRLGVHIADPTPYLGCDGKLDLDARDRATTYYLPSERILMLPPVLSEGAASLRAGAERAALSFLVELDARGSVLGHEIVSSLIRIERRLSYEQADQLIAAGGGALRLEDPYTPGMAPAPGAPLPAGLPDLPEGAVAAFGRAGLLARAMLEARAARGALILKGPDLDVKVRDGRIELRRFEPTTPAWVLVSEAMILANRLAADWLSSHGVPAIFRRQAPTDEPLNLPRGYEPAVVHAARRKLKRTEVGTVPGAHAGLGVPAYVQVTSPLRRYQDLASQHQLRAALRGEPTPFDLAGMQRIAASTDEVERGAREIERGSREYWLLKHIESLPPDTPLAAVIVRAEERRTLVELEDYVYTTGLVPRPGHKPGRRLQVVVEAVHPRQARLVVREL